jgi:hypothetical protein
MKSSVVILIVALLGAGGLYLGIKRSETQALIAEAEKAKSEAKAAEAKKVESENNRKAAEAEKKAAEAKMRTAEAEKDAAEAKLNETKEAKQKAIEEAKLKEADTANRKAAKEQAIVEEAKSKAEKEELEAKLKADAISLELEKTKAKRAADERAKAEAEERAKVAANAITQAALKKSDNELKTARLNRETERDRRLQMYKRGEVSKAEMIEIENAEKALAREESIKRGVLPADSPYRNMFFENDFQQREEVADAQSNEPLPEVVFTNEVSAIIEEVEKPSKADIELARLNEKLQMSIDENVSKIHREYERSLRAMISKAEQEGRDVDAKRYKRALWSLISDPMDVNPDAGKKFK